MKSTPNPAGYSHTTDRAVLRGHPSPEHNVTNDMFSWLLLLAWGMAAPGVAQSGRNHPVEMSLNDQREIKSQGFPELCCDDVSFTLQLSDKLGKGYLRFILTDLDMEPGSRLLLYDGPDDKSPMFPYQPEMYGHKSGDADLWAWRRQGIQTSGHSLHVKFDPATKGFTTKQYRGFRAVVWSTTSLKEHWHDWPTSDHCPFIRPAELGGLITLRPIQRQPPSTHSLHSNPTLDCVWQVKLPAEAKAYNWKVYVRFTKIDFDSDKDEEQQNFSIEVRNQSNSLGGSLFKYGRHNSETTLKANGQPEGGYMSKEGLYIRVRIPYSMQNFVVKFVYGMYTTLSDCDLGPGVGGGVLCALAGMCVPSSNVCDEVPNCSDNSDETDKRCTLKETISTTMQNPAYVLPPSTTTTTTTTTTPRTTQNYVCLIGKRCPDGTCKFSVYEECDTCEYYEKKCQDGSCIDLGNNQRCKEDPCPDHKPFRCDDGEKCLYNSYRCDQDEDCFDGTDELHCDEAGLALLSGSKLTYIIVPVVCLSIIVLACWYCCKKKIADDQPYAGGDLDMEFDTRESFTRPTPARRDPVPAAGYMPPTPRLTRVSENGETVIPLIPMSGGSMDSPVPSAPAPPSYDEVISSGMYPPPSAPSQDAAAMNMPPPPSYESVTKYSPAAARL